MHKLLLASKFNITAAPKLISSSILCQSYSTENRVISEGEKKLISLLKARFPKAKNIDVVDISGGCGAMYTIFVESIEFKNIRMVKQHQMINDVLLAEIKNNMHGLRIQTAVPSVDDSDSNRN